MQGGLIMSFCIVYYVCFLQYDFCTDDDEHVGIYQGKFVSRAHDKFVLAGNSEGHTGNNFDEDHHEDLGRPQNFCGAHQARSIPDAKLNSLKLSQWRTSLVVVYLCGRPTLFLRAFFCHSFWTSLVRVLSVGWNSVS